MRVLKARKGFHDRQLRLNFQPAVEHPVSGAAKISDRIESEKINPCSHNTRKFVKHSDLTLQALAEQVQADDRLRLLEPTSLPKQLRGWSPRPRPKTAIISYAAQRTYERRCVGESNQTIIQRFLGQRASELRCIAARIKSAKPLTTST